MAPKVRDNELLPCDLSDCDQLRFKLGRFCRSHARAVYETGDPLGRAVRRATWRPLVQEAADFVAQQLVTGHAGISDGVRWCARDLLRKATGSRLAPTEARYFAALARARSAGVAPVDLLARWIAAYLADDRGDNVRPLFRSDEHWRHQAARLFIHGRPIGGGDGWSSRTRTPQPPRRRRGDGPSVRQFAFERVNGALGLLAILAAREIVRRRLLTRKSPNGDLPEAQRVPDDTAPFYPNNT
jgi:hypothetical protein